MGDYIKATQFSIKAAKVMELLNQRHFLLRIYQGIGLNYNFLNITDKSEEFFRKALQLATRINNVKEIAASHRFIAGALRKRGDYQGSLEQIKKALFFAKESGNSHEICWSYLGHGKTYYELGRLDRATHYFDSAQYYIGPSSSGEEYSTTKMYSALMNIEKKKFSQALAHLM